MHPGSPMHSRPTSRSRFGAALVSMLLILAIAPVHAQKATPWPTASFTYVAKRDSVAQVLAEFGQTFGLKIETTAAVEQHPLDVEGTITTESPEAFLDRLSASHGLQWFDHSGTLYISRKNEEVTRAISTSSILDVRQALSDLGILDRRFGWAEMPQRGAIVVSGPPAYVELVEQTMRALPSTPAAQEVRVFRLKHAAVNDRVITYRDQQVSTSGVATLLRTLAGDVAARTGTTIAPAAPAGTPLTPLAALGAPAASGPAASAIAEGTYTASGSTAQESRGDRTPARANGRGIAPTIVADSRLNAVIVRDAPDRVALYEQLIQALDVPTYLVQIEAMIVDVDSSEAVQLGIDWQGQLQTSKGPLTAGFGTPGAPADATSAMLSLGPSSAVNFLLTRISALQGTGHARVVSRPSVLTQDNTGAMIDLSQTFYISNVGERVANVVPVSVGVTMKVTPHVIESNGRRSVELVVDIGDGGIAGISIQGQPTVQSSTVSTQAVMGENQSLLIGGMRTEQEIQQHDRVPVLGDIPVLGALFGKQSSSTQRRERLFVLTPRIIVPTEMQQVAP